MALELKQQVRLSQQLVMTPQLQQAIKLLQLSRMELVDLVQQELQENPVLEEGVESEEDRAAAEANGPGDSPEAADATEATAELTQPELMRDTEPGTAAEATDAEKFADVDWQSYAEDYPQTGPREARDDADRPSFEATLTRRATLAEHLHWQLQLSGFPPDEEAAAHFIIGNIDDRGYLQSSLEEIARQAGVPETVVASALATRPPGQLTR